MKELLKMIVTPLVDNPNEISIDEVEADKSLILQLKVAKEDTGKVIGKQGRIAKAIRHVMAAAATKKNIKVKVEIL